MRSTSDERLRYNICDLLAKSQPLNVHDIRRRLKLAETKDDDVLRAVDDLRRLGRVYRGPFDEIWLTAGDSE